MSYKLIDSGDQKKLEQIGPYLIERPSYAALWKPRLDKKKYWDKIDARFQRNPNKWTFFKKMEKSWNIEFKKNLFFKIELTDFGHIGLFPEHFYLWEQIIKAAAYEKVLDKERAFTSVKVLDKEKLSTPTKVLYKEKDFERSNVIENEETIFAKKPKKILNLFAYSGGGTIYASKMGMEVCHVDASKSAVLWARENAKLNNLEEAPIRWIVDDVFKFLKREERRNVFYDGIILDPPSFGRGSKQEVFKFESDINELLLLCKNVLSKDFLFFTLSCHTPGITPIVLNNLLAETFDDADDVSSSNGNMKRTLFANAKNYEKSYGELVLESEDFSLPSGSFASWIKK